MTDEIEAVARAIHDGRIPFEVFGENPENTEFARDLARAAIAALDAVRGARKVQTCPRAPYPFRYCPDCTGGNDCVMTPPPETAP